MEEEKEGHAPLKEEEEVQVETIPTKIIDATKKRKRSEAESDAEEEIKPKNKKSKKE